MEITILVQPFEVDEEVYDDLTGKVCKVVGLSYEVGRNDPEQPNVSSVGCWGVWIDSEYLSGGRHPWELSKLTDELKAGLYAAGRLTPPDAGGNKAEWLPRQRRKPVSIANLRRYVVRTLSDFLFWARYGYWPRHYCRTDDYRPADRDFEWHQRTMVL